MHHGAGIEGRSGRTPHAQPLLTAAIIVRDEADHLRRCLDSLRGLCDDVVVVDTGSSDGSVAVAASSGARVLHRAWDGDFAAARNHALDAVDSTWVLYIDADEEVLPVDVVEVRRQLESATDVVAFAVGFRVRVGWTKYWEQRIWRHQPDVRFLGRIHETTVPDLERVAAREGQRVERGLLEIQHHGYEGDQTAKHRRNLPLLLAQLERTPRRVYLWDQLGRVQLGLGDPEEAERSWRHALEVIRADGAKAAVDVLVYGSLADLLLRQGRSATTLIEAGLIFDPGHHTLHWLQAQQAAADGRWSDALEVLDGLLAAGRLEEHHPVLAYNRAIFEAWPQQMIGECLFELGRHLEAATAFDDALAWGADPLEMRSKAAICRSLAAANGAP